LAVLPIQPELAYIVRLSMDRYPPGCSASLTPSDG